MPRAKLLPGQSDRDDDQERLSERLLRDRLQRAAAFFAAAALLLTRGRGRAVRVAVGGFAAWLVVMVAGSRVLLDVHWLSDVIAGLALGCAWFSVCAIAFGGRLLEFGSTADEIARVATHRDIGPGPAASPAGWGR